MLDSYLFFYTIPLFLLVLFYYFKKKKLPTKLTNEEFINSITDSAGMISIPISFLNTAISQLTDSDKNLFTHIPSYLQVYLQNFKSSDLAYVSKERLLNNHSREEWEVDKLRAITIAATLYGFKIPLSLCCFDDRMMSLYYRYTQDFRLSYIILPKGNISDVEIQRMSTKEAMSNYIDYIDGIGRALYESSIHFNYVGITCLVFHLNSFTSKQWQAKEARMAVTMYAGLMCIKIPLSYIDLSTESLVLMKHAQMHFYKDRKIDNIFYLRKSQNG